MGCSICSKEKQTKAKIFTVVPSRLLRDPNKSINEVYLLTSQISDGIHGKIISGIHRITGQKRALKIIPKRLVKGTKTRFRFMNEISALKELKHQNLMKIHEFYEDDKSYFLVADLVAGRDLLEFLIQGKTLEEVERQAVVRQLIETLEFLQGKNVSQVDLRPEKIIIETGNKLKVINFGTSVFSKARAKIRRSKGRVEFSPPEDHLNKSRTTNDLWPAGVIFYVMVTGQLPFHGNTEDEIIGNLIQGAFNVPEAVSQEITSDSLDLLKKMLNPEPSSRISPIQALSHSWFSSEPKGRFSEVVSAKILSNLRELRGNIQLKNSLLCFMTNELLNSCEKQELLANFKGRDLEMTGKVSFEEVRNVSKAVWGEKINLEDVEKICVELDPGQSGFIEYQSFCGDVLEKGKKINFERLENCFKSFQGTWKVFDGEVKELLESFEVESESWDKVCEILTMENGMNMKDLKNLLLTFFK